MLKSMTGFGRGEFLDANQRVIVEVKAVNHRYNEIVIRMPKHLGSLEDRIRRAVAGSLARGRIDVYITLDDYSQKRRIVRVDKELAMAYHSALEELGSLLNTPLNNNVYHIAKYPDVLKVEEVAEDVELIWSKLNEAIDQAITNLLGMRMAEGKAIQTDLLSRVEKLTGLIEQIEVRAPEILEEYRNKLSARMRELVVSVGVEPDEGRLLQETAIFADRTNFTEEIVRFKSHMAQLSAALLSGEAVGRKLDFIIQEINRETNTIGSKANDLVVAGIVVEIKSEIEKVREQIQNIE
ncbi:MAG TPA: YicC family protein [Sporomusaceae bacterium]|uniref:YicC/YloC family endoribonuclease n=1 Tax=Anaerospora sp. TaxID=1960278 RepID=UPI000EED83BE|nr:YicC/YloC family endoribonuclease [Anaerospora sp.]MDF2928066.1 hypothetical protein [Anaerospora sp.]HAK74064.1 YicC family protein [Sporomusaceae bacterium]